MFFLAVKSALAKRLRLVSTALSVLLGVAFLSGTLVFTDTLRRTFDDLFADVFDTTDAYVRSSTSLDLGFGETQRGRISDDVVATVRGVDGVDDAQGIVQAWAQLVAADGDPIGDLGNGPPTFAMTYVTGDLSPWELTPGSREPGAGEIVVDQASARKGGYELGDTVTLLTQTGAHQLVLVGTANFGTVDAPGGASVSLVDLPASQELLLGGRHEIDAVMVHAAPGVDEANLAARIHAVLPDGTEVLTGSEITAETQSTMHEAMGFFSTFLLVFAGIGLVVACFTIYNTFQIVVTQRTREMALLRSVGATRSQVLVAQLLEATLIGVVASALGLGAGVVVARGLTALMEALGIDVPAGGTVLTSRTIVVAMAVGTVVTIVAAVFPSLRASRTPPIAAIRDVAVDHTARSRGRLVTGALVTVVGVMAYGYGLAAGEVAGIGLGALCTFVGVFVLGPLIARPASRALGTPVAAVAGTTGQLAKQNAMRNPKRTSRTGGALMVGVALVAAITVMTTSMKDWMRAGFEEAFVGDYVVSTTSQGYGGLAPEVAARVTALDEVQGATAIRVGAARDVTAGKDVSYLAIDPTSAAGILHLDMTAGQMSDLTDDGILLDRGEARSHGVTVGDEVELAFLNGSSRTLTVQGVYANDDVMGSYLVSQGLHEESGADQFDIGVFVVAADGASDADVRAALEGVAADQPNADVQSRSEYVDAQAGRLDQLLNLMYALLALAILIALVNIANSLSLSIHERTRELGLLRAVGTTRRQTSASVLWEAVLVAVLGTLLGIVIGTGFGWSVSVVGRGMSRDAFVLPVTPLVVIASVAVVGAVVVALRPAWRAAHVDVLTAIAGE